jgi:hypothetical protein
MRISQTLLLRIALSGLLLRAGALHATEVSLQDWCINVNGSVDASSVTNNSSNSCNGGTNAPLSSVATGAFDQTLAQDSASNTLGTITVSLGPGTNQYVSLYADYDINYNEFGSVDDFASLLGATQTGYSYELDNPNTSTIFADFASNALTNTDNVDSQGATVQCCNVSWALAASGLDVLVGGSASVTFHLGTIVPTSGFYLKQTNQDTNDSIYLTIAENLQNPLPGSDTPEPATIGLALSAAGMAMLAWAGRLYCRFLHGAGALAPFSNVSSRISLSHL